MTSKGLHAFSFDISGKDRIEPVPPIAYRLVREIDAAFVQKIFDVSQRKWKLNMHHHGQSYDSKRRFGVAKGADLGHPARVGRPSSQINAFPLTMP